MITDLNVNCNTYNEKVVNNYSIIKYICPKCGAKHSLIKHCYYKRYCCFLDNNLKICEKQITILRVLCKGCSSTHAILPNNIIPYGTYDNLSIIHFLTEYFVYKQSVLSISQKYGIDYRTLYQFISKFMRFLYSLYIFLRVALGFTSDISDISGMLQVINKFPNGFFYQYFLYTKWIFMMTKFQNIIPNKIYIGVYFEPPT